MVTLRSFCASCRNGASTEVYSSSTQLAPELVRYADVLVDLNDTFIKSANATCSREFSRGEGENETPGQPGVFTLIN